jgi:hypothetical protein
MKLRPPLSKEIAPWTQGKVSMPTQLMNSEGEMRWYFKVAFGILREAAPEAGIYERECETENPKSRSR